MIGSPVLRIALLGMVIWLVLSFALTAWGAPVSVLMAFGFAVFLALIGWIAKKRSAVDAVSFLNVQTEDRNEAPAAAAEWISAFGMVGLFAAITARWMEGFALIGGLIGGWALSTLLIAPLLSASGARSLPDWFGRRHGAAAARVVGAVVFFLTVMMIAIQAGLLAALMHYTAGIPTALTVLAFALILLVMVGGGGRSSLIPAQAALYPVLLLGLLVPLAWIAVQQDLVFVPHVASGAMLHEITAIEGRYGIPDRILHPWKPFDMAVVGLVTMLGTAVLPHTQMRVFQGAPPENASSEAMTGILILLALAAVPVAAVILRAEALMLDGGLLDGLEPQEVLTLAMQLFSPPGWVLTALALAVAAGAISASGSAALGAATAFDVSVENETAGGVLAQFRWLIALAVCAASILTVVVMPDVVDGFLWLVFFATASLFAPLLLSLLWHRMSGVGVIAGIVTGALTCLAIIGLGQHYGGLGVGLFALLASALASLLTSLALPDAAEQSTAVLDATLDRE